jgi:hypothetical protein
MITYFNSTNPTQALASSQAFTIAAGNGESERLQHIIEPSRRGPWLPTECPSHDDKYQCQRERHCCRELD